MPTIGAELSLGVVDQSWPQTAHVVTFGGLLLLGGLAARWRPRVLVPTGIALLVAATLWLSRLDATSTYSGGLAGPMVLAGLGSGLVFTPLTRTILATVRPEHVGAASGTPQVTQYTGTALGVAVLVGVYAAAARAGALVPSALATGMLAAAVFALPAAVLAVLADRTPKPQSAPVG